jgi:hypothetical protein
MVIKTKYVPARNDLDAAIRDARRRYHAAETFLESLAELRICHRLQVLRYRAYGSFLPRNDGWTYLFDTTIERWSHWKVVTMAPLSA